MNPIELSTNKQKKQHQLKTITQQNQHYHNNQDHEMRKGYIADLDTLTIRDLSESELQNSTLSPPNDINKKHNSKFLQQYNLTKTKIQTEPSSIQYHHNVGGRGSNPNKIDHDNIMHPLQFKRCKTSRQNQITTHFQENESGDFQEISIPSEQRVPSSSKQLDEKWTTIPDLDQFFNSVYSYFNQSGYRAIVTRNLLNIFLLLFVSHFLAFLALYVNWRMLLSCKDEQCDVSQIFVYQQPNVNMITYVTVKMIYISVWFYVTWLLLAFILTVQQAGNLRTLFENQFGIPDSQLVFYNWDQIMKKLMKLQEKYEFCKVKRELTKLDIVNRITRVDNYFIGMMDQGIFDFQCCSCKKKKKTQSIKEQNLSQKCSLTEMIKKIFKKKVIKQELKRQNSDSMMKAKSQDLQFQNSIKRNSAMRKRAPVKYDKIIFTQTFVWAIRATLLSSLFQKPYSTKLNISSLTPRNLKIKFCFFGILLIILCVPLFILGIFVRILKYFEKIQKSGKVANTPEGNRIWSPWFFWKARGFNELSHQVNSRLQMTNKVAMKLSSPSSARKMIFKFFALLSGTVFGIVLCLSLFDDLLAKQMFWPMAISGILANIFAIMGGGYNSAGENGKVYSSNRRHANCTHNLQIDNSTTQSYSLLDEVENLRHLLWNQSLDMEQPYLCHQRQCLTPLQTMIGNHFQSRTWILVKELFSILLLPWLFIFQLVPRAGIICSFIKSRTVSINGVGDVYCHASFDLQKFGHKALMTMDQDEDVFFSESEDGLQGNNNRRRGNADQLETRLKIYSRQHSYRMPLNLKMQKAFVAYIIRHNEQHNFKALSKLLKEIIKFERAECYEMCERQFNLEDKKRYFERVKQREQRINRDLEDRKLFDGNRKNLYEQPQQTFSRSSQLQEQANEFRLEEAFTGIHKSIFECMDVYAFERYLN